MNITVYTKNKCPACDFTKRALNSAGLSFEVMNIEDEGNEYLVEYIKRNLGYSTLPVVVVTDQFGRMIDKWCSMRPDKLARLKEAA